MGEELAVVGRRTFKDTHLQSHCTLTTLDHPYGYVGHPRHSPLGGTRGYRPARTQGCVCHRRKAWDTIVAQTLSPFSNISEVVTPSSLPTAVLVRLQKLSYCFFIVPPSMEMSNCLAREPFPRKCQSTHLFLRINRIGSRPQKTAPFDFGTRNICIFHIPCQIRQYSYLSSS